MKLGVLTFFDDLKNFLRGGRVLGVDIGSASIKIAELTGRGGHFRLENYGILETKDYLENPSKALQTSSLRIVDKDVAALIKALIKETGMRARIAIFSLPAFSVFITPLEMPVLSPEETERAVMFQSRQFIPLPPSQVSIDWTKIGEYENDRGQKFQRILLIGVPNELLETYKRVAKMAGLRLVFLELDSFALLRGFLKDDNQTTLVVDIGALETTVTIADNGILQFSGVSDHGGLYLTQALTRSLGVSPKRAEDLKKKRGLLGTGGDFELSTLLLSFLDVIIEEVSKIRSVYEGKYGKKIQKLVLTGAGANLAGLDHYFSKHAGVPVYRPSLFADVLYDQKLEPIIKNVSNEIAVAVGLAKRYFN